MGGTESKVITITKGEPGQPDHRIFDSESINRHIEESLKLLPPDRKVAFVGYADQTGVRGAIVGRIEVGGQLEWTVFATKPWDGSFEYGAGVRWSL